MAAPYTSGQLESFETEKEWGEKMCSFVAVIDGKELKGYGGVDKSVRTAIGSNVVVWQNERNGKLQYNVMLDQKATKPTGQPTAQYKDSPKKPATAKGGYGSPETQERITNDASVNKAIECIRIATQQKDKEGQPMMTAATRKKLSDPYYVASFAVELAGDIAQAIKNGDIGKPLPKFLEEVELDG